MMNKMLVFPKFGPYLRWKEGWREKKYRWHLTMQEKFFLWDAIRFEGNFFFHKSQRRTDASKEEKTEGRTENKSLCGLEEPNTGGSRKKLFTQGIRKGRWRDLVVGHRNPHKKWTKKRESHERGRRPNRISGYVNFHFTSNIIRLSTCRPLCSTEDIGKIKFGVEQYGKGNNMIITFFIYFIAVWTCCNTEDETTSMGTSSS